MSELRTNETIREYLESCGLLEKTTELCVIITTINANNNKNDIFGYSGRGDSILYVDDSEMLNEVIVDFNGYYDPKTMKHYFEFII